MTYHAYPTSTDRRSSTNAKRRRGRRCNQSRTGTTHTVPAAERAQTHTAAAKAPKPFRNEGWQSKLLYNSKGNPLNVLANVVTALRFAPEWKGVLAYNEFTQTVTTDKAPPFSRQKVEAWSDQEDRLTADWLQHQGINATVSTTYEGVQAVARGRSFHPIRQYLESLRWDGVKRTPTWLSKYMGADENDYTRAVGERWLISAVARIFQPGCQADSMLILEGPQGLYKSTSLRTLGGEWFTDQLDGVSNKDAALQVHGAWIIEVAELAGMTKPEVGKIKAFVSRRVDRFRPPYGRNVGEYPRQSVFAGTVNETTYLRDETGGRRFWPVTCTGALIDDLKRDRDQLWAEAVQLYKDGANWWIDTHELATLAAEQQESRYQADVWQDDIAAWAEGEDTVSIAEALRDCLHKSQCEWTQQDQSRVARCLVALGWERYRTTDTPRQWRYRRKQQ